MNLIKVNKKYTNNKLIYLDKKAYQSFLKLNNLFFKKYRYNLIIKDGYKTNYIIKREYLSKLYNTGRAFKIMFKDLNAYNFVYYEIIKLGIIHENDYFYYVGSDANLINKYHLSIKGYLKMFQ